MKVKEIQTFKAPLLEFLKEQTCKINLKDLLDDPEGLRVVLLKNPELRAALQKVLLTSQPPETKLFANLPKNWHELFAQLLSWQRFFASKGLLEVALQTNKVQLEAQLQSLFVGKEITYLAEEKISRISKKIGPIIRVVLCLPKEIGDELYLRLICKEEVLGEHGELKECAESYELSIEKWLKSMVF